MFIRRVGDNQKVVLLGAKMASLVVAIAGPKHKVVGQLFVDMGKQARQAQILPKEAIMFSTCSFCSLRAHPQHERMAVRTSTGRITCMTCRKSTPAIEDDMRHIFNEPQIIRNLVADLIATDDGNESFLITGITVGEGHGAVAQGLGPDDIPTTICVAHAGVKIEISYSGNDIKAAQSMGTGEFYDKLPGVPESVHKAAQALANNGFYLTGRDLGSLLRHLTFRRGPRAANQRCVSVNITWVD